MRIFQLITLVLLIAAFAPGVSPSSVVKLNSHTFKTTLVHNNILVFFHTPWCKTCRPVFDEFRALAEDAQSMNVLLGEVDCEQHHRVAHAEGIRGFPTIKLYVKGGDKKGVAFTGKRTKRALIEFLREQSR